MALHHVRPGESADLGPLGANLASAKTSAIAKTAAFEAIRLVLKAGSELSAHEVPGEIMLHCIEGRVALTFDDRTVELSADQWIYLDGGKRHAVSSIQDSSLLLTILFAR